MFGVIFGAAAASLFGVELTIVMSLLVFSGSVQFAVLGSVAGGPSAIAILLAAVALSARNLVFGAAVASGRRAGPVLLVAGAMRAAVAGIAVAASAQAA